MWCVQKTPPGPFEAVLLTEYKVRNAGPLVGNLTAARSKTKLQAVLSQASEGDLGDFPSGSILNQKEIWSDVRQIKQ